MGRFLFPSDCLSVYSHSHTHTSNHNTYRYIRGHLVLSQSLSSYECVSLCLLSPSRVGNQMSTKVGQPLNQFVHALFHDHSPQCTWLCTVYKPMDSMSKSGSHFLTVQRPLLLIRVACFFFLQAPSLIPSYRNTRTLTPCSSLLNSGLWP
ncbi:hypothetical protein BDP81DRAFT_80051 [Colletotrichum phormii]|uniref:Uncharacterized protein n=1 Tax=Colletotrichum phormii TaxID=359342 RepID=A0AAJ0A3B1_9PEZI|nr:uncharacterized protein BDP81DRAFT_80051 [Colletotrichum phormii]KAK1654247.1 hypothetical protein BDP81DRAFT_80051 [Colletotrichum phormii]